MHTPKHTLGLLATAMLAIAPAAHAEEAKAPAEKEAANIDKIFSNLKISGGASLENEPAAGGDLEASMLTALAIDAAANKIAQQVNQIGEVKTVYVHAGAEFKDFNELIAVESGVKYVRGLFAQLLQNPQQKLAIDPSKPVVVSGGDVAASIVSGLLGLLQQDVKIYSAAVTGGDALLARAVAGKITGKTAFSAETISLSKLKDTQLYREIGSVGEESLMINELKQAEEGKTAPTEKDKARLAKLTAALAAKDELFKALATRDDKGRSLLNLALRQAVLSGDTNYTLGVTIDTKGGTKILKNELPNALWGRSLERFGRRRGELYLGRSKGWFH